MNVAIVGLGYVGAVTAACLARLGQSVIGVDTDPHKVEAIAAGRSPIDEPGLDELLAEAVASGRLTTGTIAEAVERSDVIMIAVGTPSAPSGALDLAALRPRDRRDRRRAEGRDGRFRTVVVRSTVLPGNHRRGGPAATRVEVRHAGRDRLRPRNEPGVPARVVEHPGLLRGQPERSSAPTMSGAPRRSASCTTESRRRSSSCRSARRR